MTLYQHQDEGANWLASRRRAYLGDVPGLGKTRTLIEALRRSQTNTYQGVLVICPAIVRTHWAREFTAVGGEEWTDVVHIKSYAEIVRGGYRLMKELLDDGVNHLLIDEAHRLKHATSQRTQLILGPDGCARRMERVYLASGTPVPKNPYSFWTVLASMFPEVAVQHRLRTADDFKARFCTIEHRWTRGQLREKILPRIKNAEEFREILSAVMLRRTLDDVGLDVPAIDWQTLRLDPMVDASEFARSELFDGVKLYRAGEDPLRWTDFGLLEEIANDPHVARMRRRLGELKVQPVVKLLTSQLEDSDDKVVLFAHHRNVLNALALELHDFNPVMIDGATSKTGRDQAIDRFQHNPNVRVFIGQNIACMEGMDGLQHAARRAIIVEPDWTRDVNEQLGKRVARIGQGAGHCVVQMVALAGTLDEAIVGQNLQEVRMAASIGLGEK